MSKTKLLCEECRVVSKVSKYLRDGWVQLECGHQRNVKEINSDKQKENEVINKLDNEKPSEFRKFGDYLEELSKQDEE